MPHKKYTVSFDIIVEEQDKETTSMDEYMKDLLPSVVDPIIEVVTNVQVNEIPITEQDISYHTTETSSFLSILEEDERRLAK